MFLDASVKRPLVSVGAVVDEGNRVVLGLTESYIDHVATGRKAGTGKEGCTMRRSGGRREDGEKGSDTIEETNKKRKRRRSSGGERRYASTILVNLAKKGDWARDDTLSVPKLVQALLQRQSRRGGLPRWKGMFPKFTWTTSSWATRGNEARWKRTTRAVSSTVVPRKPTHDWICRTQTPR